MEKLKVVLTIAGSDCSGGAGIQADIKTITCCGAYAESAITALTAQNTLGVKSIFHTSSQFLADQLDCIFTDIVPDSVKIGMVSNVELIEIIAEKLKFYKAQNIVLDPVISATSGSLLIEKPAINALKEKLFPLASLITPNIPESEILTGLKIENKEQMIIAGKKLCKDFNLSVLIKGGHAINDANDLLCIPNKEPIWFLGKKIENPNTHGTGCTLSSAIATFLAKGETLENSIKKAKNYISSALNAQLNLGKSSGPLMHNFEIVRK